MSQHDAEGSANPQRPALWINLFLGAFCLMSRHLGNVMSRVIINTGLSRMHGTLLSCCGRWSVVWCSTLPTLAVSRLAFSSTKMTPCFFSASFAASSCCEGGCSPPATMRCAAACEAAERKSTS